MEECKKCKYFNQEGNIGYCSVKKRIMLENELCIKYEERRSELQDFRKSTEEDLIKIYLKLDEIESKIDKLLKNM